MVMVSLAWTGNVAAPQQGIFTHLEKKGAVDFLQGRDLSSMIIFSDEFTEFLPYFVHSTGLTTKWH
jgi:hypothetical protein